MQKIIDARCPCCDKPLKIEMIESETGIQFRLFHYTPEVPYSEIQANGYEFGSTEGGE